MKQQNTTYAIIAVVALIVGFILGAWWKDYSMNDAGDITEDVNATTTVQAGNNNATTTVGTGSNGPTNSVFVATQAAGKKIVVESVNVPVTSWIVITEDVSGQPGWILGARRVAPGQRTTEVPLLRATTKGNTYHAVIYKDNGDGIFDHRVDTVVEGSNDKIAESVFQAS